MNFRAVSSSGPQNDAQRSDSAALYFRSLSRGERRRNGQVYTPPHLADFILDQAGFPESAAKTRTTLLDPACGGGVFLERAISGLAAHLRTVCPRQEFRDRLVFAVANGMYGVDLDGTGCELARQAVRRAVQLAAPGPLPASFFEDNIVHADFLICREVELLPPCQDAGGFDYIVGNPPYVAATQISTGYKATIRRLFSASSGRVDLYSLFIERSLNLLKKGGGRLAFITPDKFLVSQTGRALREVILAKSSVRLLAMFGSHKVFADAATVPCVTVLERSESAPGDAVEILRCSDTSEGPPRIAVIGRERQGHALLTSGPWHLLEKASVDIADKLLSTHVRLRQVSANISAGIATGRDGIFVFPAGSQPEIEPELRRSVVRGRDVKAYAIADPQLEILLPYTFDPKTGTASLVEIKRFPGAESYLKRHVEDLKRRHCVRVWEKSWCDLHDPISRDIARDLKIIVPDLAHNNRFALDNGCFLPLHSAYYLLPNVGVDPCYLLGILNSQVSEFLIRCFAPVMKDRFVRYRRQFIAELPVPNASTGARKAIAAAARAGDDTRTEELVFALFGVSQADRNKIRTALMVAKEGE